MLTVAIQAGGRSSRMGEDKALRSFLGRPLIERVIERLRPAADEMILTTNRAAEYAFLGLPVFPDVQPGRGALGGLYTALRAASEPLVAVVACDMPFACAPLLEAAARRLLLEEADAGVPETERGLEPLHAVYRRSTCLPAVQAALQANLWKVTAWFPQVKLCTLPAEEIRRYDPSGRAFWNINTPGEFAEAERLALAND